MSDLARLGGTVWARFNAPRVRIVWYYGEVLRLARATPGDEPLVGDLEAAVRAIAAAAARTTGTAHHHLAFLRVRAPRHCP